MKHLLVLGTILLVGAACSRDADEEGAAPSGEPARQGAADQPGGPAAEAPPAKGRVHADLLQLAHMADVDHGGLYVDLGTPARNKYTVANWKTGWGSDAKEGNTTYTIVAGNTGRLYLPIEQDGPVTLRMRVKPIGTGTMQLFVNNEMLQAVRLDKGPAFHDYDAEVPAKALVRGENHVLIRLGGTTKVRGEEVSVAIASVHVLAGAADAQTPEKPSFRPPSYDTLVGEAKVGGTARQALQVQAPTTLSWHLQIPEDATFAFRVGASRGKGKVAVRATAEGGKTEQLFESEVGGEWKNGSVSLKGLAGRVARIDLVAEGDADVAWSTPALMVPEVELAKLDKPAKSVIVLTIDTLRADKLHAYDPKSPVKQDTLDAFMKEGATFTASQAPENWTKPSVASILTGLYPMTHRTKKSESKLSDKALMVSEVYKKHGFSTATFLANGYVSDKFGFKQGWDHYTNYIRENKSTEAENVFGEAGTWIEKHKDERFFVYIQTIDPHVPYDPPEEYLKLYDAREYDGQVKPRMTPDLLEKAKRNPPKITFDKRDKERLEALHDGEITYHDVEFGKFVERLKKLGLYDQVLFVVTSDHGEEFYDHESYGHGHSVYQELVHVPLMFRWPGVIEGGKRIAETVGTLDIAPTVLSATGHEIPEVMEGVNRMDHLRGRTPVGPAVAFSDFLDDRRVIRAGRWKLILRGINSTLFDLEKDPGEQKELDGRNNPIAMRYCRTMLGQFLGAGDRGDWLNPNPKFRSVPLDQVATDIDAKTRENLKALGYAN
jgi:arylsulfatase A-like enzyme